MRATQQVPVSNIALGDPESGERFLQEVKPPGDFLGLLNQKEFSDITLIFDGNHIHCHQVVLASRSAYFEALFTHNFREKEQKQVTFSSQDSDGVPLESFMLMLRHIYSDSLRIETRHIYDLLSVSL